MGHCGRRGSLGEGPASEQQVVGSLFASCSSNTCFAHRPSSDTTKINNSSGAGAGNNNSNNNNFPSPLLAAAAAAGAAKLLRTKSSQPVACLVPMVDDSAPHPPPGRPASSLQSAHPRVGRLDRTSNKWPERETPTGWRASHATCCANQSFA